MSRKLPLAELLRASIVTPGVAPAAAAAIAFRVGNAWQLVCAAAGQRSPSHPEPVTPQSPFDLASVSKPIVAAALVRLARVGLARVEGWSLGAPLAELLPEAQSTPTAECSLESLLAHRAGLVAHRSLFSELEAQRPIERSRLIRRAADARRPECTGAPAETPEAAVYSDLGYLLAGAAAERAFERPLDALVAAQIAAPLNLSLGSARQWRALDPSFATQVVPTEVVPWRGGELVGVVHDDNAWAFAGHGLSGQAGLFGTAEAVARFGIAMLDSLARRDHAWLDYESARLMTRERPGGALRAGFDGKSSSGSSAGERAGPLTFGHLGFTGTSLWCDPDRARVAVLLTNRVRYGPDRSAICRARPLVHDALFALAEAWEAP